MAIRYDASLNKELRSTVSNFNRKIARLEKEGRELLPDKVYVADLKEFYQDRRELKRKLRQLQKFSERGFEEAIKTVGGRKTSLYKLQMDKEERALSIRRDQAELNRLRKLASPTDTLRRAEINRLEDSLKILKRDLNTITPEQYKTFEATVVRALDYDKRKERFQENFFQIVTSEASYAGVAQYKLDYIHQKFAELTPDQLLKLAKEDPDINAIVNYSPTKGNRISKSRMKEIMDKLYQNLQQKFDDFEF